MYTPGGQKRRDFSQYLYLRSRQELGKIWRIKRDDKKYVTGFKRGGSESENKTERRDPGWAVKPLNELLTEVAEDTWMEVNTNGNPKS